MLQIMVATKNQVNHNTKLLTKLLGVMSQDEDNLPQDDELDIFPLVSIRSMQRLETFFGETPLKKCQWVSVPFC